MGDSGHVIIVVDAAPAPQYNWEWALYSVQSIGIVRHHHRSVSRKRSTTLSILIFPESPMPCLIEREGITKSASISLTSKMYIKDPGRGFHLGHYVW
jgi:hypothetical protein